MTDGPSSPWPSSATANAACRSEGFESAILFVVAVRALALSRRVSSAFGGAARISSANQQKYPLDAVNVSAPRYVPELRGETSRS